MSRNLYIPDYPTLSEFRELKHAGFGLSLALIFVNWVLANPFGDHVKSSGKLELSQPQSILTANQLEKFPKSHSYFYFADIGVVQANRVSLE